MTFKRTGLILYVKKYEECITFYNEIVELDILFKDTELTCFDLYGTYLMVEKEDRREYLQLKENFDKNFSCIRINVEHVKTIAENLINKNIDVDYQEHSWGTVAKFFDPDGNLLAYKDEESFMSQIEKHIIRPE
ncbi:VOC family protein [Aquimarina sp. I32.4]|uniref:VOC family protein n=1 Tax=Aquimarina sp. I32.4 TaxID=2053903 RepID=UPI000CDEBCF4|nr:glyoxalase/bleomycin resistance/dioxygenase family protein [Aquimarina sp. I32.4]